MTFSWDIKHGLSDSMEMSVEINVLVLSGAFLLTVILLTGMCLRCRRHHMPTSIQQRYSTDYRQQSPGFSLARPPYTSTATFGHAPPSSLRSPLSPQRPKSVTLSRNESNLSSDDPEEVYVNEMRGSDEEEHGSGYLLVLPSEIPGIDYLCHSQQSLVSKSSQSTEPPYVNIETEKDIDNDNCGGENYVNLESMENTDNSDNEGEDSNYVNTTDM
ncbi:hypothetical protein DPEC_G00310430 [Dallia pectoralis]|uniref:Uncharacterized protein n=1 Tax=Dallia pectoralis TaxID=75939 RepID=A0ACC2FFA1_DALPE|nr:hypothetical protein DPEC_G00310430 [Dallia pectoralis]